MAEPGPLLIIGGHEDKAGDAVILTELARLLRGGRLVLATVASQEPESYVETYRQAFAALGVNDVVELYVQKRSDSGTRESLAPLDGAAGVFFTGGDQLRIASQIGDTAIEKRILEMHAEGALIAGTSAGASALSETMLVNGSSTETCRLGDLHMAPGLGLMRDAIIDQHFAERGRFGRLLGAVAHNPRLLGMGIDEDTAMLVEGRRGRVLGVGTVYIVDGQETTHSNVAEGRPEVPLSMFDVRMHVLSRDDVFDFDARRPSTAG